MNLGYYRTVFLKKWNPQVIQFMLDQEYPFFSEQNKVSFLKLNQRKYICLDDLIYGKQNHSIEISNEGLMFIFQKFYYLIKHLSDNKLQFFKIEKQHIWINIDGNKIIGLTLSHPQMDFESNFEGKKFKKNIFNQIYDLLELNKKQKELLQQCLNKDMNSAEKIEINEEEIFIGCDKQLFNKLENSMQVFKERLNETNCNINEFKYILENIPYYFYKANLYNKSPIELIEKIINNQSDIKTLCKRYNGYKQLGKFIIKDEIIIKLNDQDYLINGSLKQELSIYLEEKRSSLKNLNFIQTLLGQITNIINIDQQQILEIIHELDIDFEKCSQEQKQQMIERIQQNINLQVRNRLQDLK